jgi:acyl-CoA thioester hydrolase
MSSAKLDPARSTYPLWVEETIRNADTDQFQHVNNAAIASYCEAGRMGLFARPDIATAMCGLNVVVVKMTIVFEQELYYPGAVQIGTRVSAIGNTSLQVAQGLYSERGRFATSEATCVLMERAQHRPTRVPDVMRAAFMPVPESDLP